MLNDIRIAVFRLRPENSDFLRQKGSADCQHFTPAQLCQESRGTATEASSHHETAVTGLQGGPYGKLTMPKTYVKKAETASRLFYFTEKEMQKIKN